MRDTGWARNRGDHIWHHQLLRAAMNNMTGLLLALSARPLIPNDGIALWFHVAFQDIAFAVDGQGVGRVED